MAATISARRARFGSAIITRRGADRLRSGHVWVYRSDVREAAAAPGDVVSVSDDRCYFLGKAFYSDRSQIALRFLTREDVDVDSSFFRERIQAAAAFRKQVVEESDVCRLVYGEADQLPSIIVDRYGTHLVIQTLSQGAERWKPELVNILQEMFSPAGIVERNDPKVRLLEGLDQKVSVLRGDVPAEVVAAENGVRFHYDLLKGQKTGGFLDQRENRRAAAQYAGPEVLDCFTYNGGFALTLARRCNHVEAVDLSGSALEVARRNQEINQLTNVSFREANVFDLLNEYDDAGRRFDMVVLDPPAFAKNRGNLEAARRGYKEINLRALKILRRGGYLVTCSCSHLIPEHLFLALIAEAANDLRRELVVVERRTQSRDHPIHLTVPETLYLKCLIIRAF